ncbi:MAG TPA: hypothetical protein DIW47_08875 [Bacteroidetes bacterium]|nr:hypothetical protein [Bacteroidota bacterium]
MKGFIEVSIGMQNSRIVNVHHIVQVEPDGQYCKVTLSVKDAFGKSNVVLNVTESYTEIKRKIVSATA